MVAGISKEIISRKGESSAPLLSIYFGGGTPSLLTIKELAFLLNTIKQNYSINSCVEITLEANPEDISFESLYQWQELGLSLIHI